jgi:hypothetical protein
MEVDLESSRLRASRYPDRQAGIEKIDAVDLLRNLESDRDLLVRLPLLPLRFGFFSLQPRLSQLLGFVDLLRPPLAKKEREKKREGVIEKRETAES